MNAPFASTKLILAAAMGALFIGSAGADETSEGELLFKRQCAVCHSVVPGQTLMGPSLAGIVGRPAGAVDGFRYSPAMKEAGFDWTAEDIDAFIESPRKKVHGTNMAYPGERKPERRAAIIDYLSTLKAGD
ncbi:MULTISPECIES: cytochrome c family protein [unclassified Hyphomonas]|jgi:cytochrome c|uniref:c-type cytochrome n=1 Tax=unclassified Hyphomonas TaxID=2630699 RepID=UPI000458C8AB|nr:MULTISPECIES: c-type cytochrome [unclassified Hyphomonas]KCZ46093.1 hypothetical protein HY17_10060 [Hyphomonas sp. CY54-11-8]